jgi:hypothetical protein
MGFNYSPKIVTDGLVLYLDAANSKSYPGSGTTWSDLSRGGNNGTLVNSPTFSAANGGFFAFNGSNQYANCGNPLTFTDSFTISYFFNTTSTGIVKVMMGMYNGSGADWFIGLDASNRLNFSFGSPSKIDLTTSTTVNDGVWRQGICVYNKSLNSTFIYLNGILQNSTTSIPATVTQAGGNLMIGTFGSNLGFYFPGNIATTQIYNRALTATEVQQNYDAQKSRFGLI